MNELETGKVRTPAPNPVLKVASFDRRNGAAENTEILDPVIVAWAYATVTTYNPTQPLSTRE